MNVTLPVQLLSFVGKVLLAYGLPEAAETVCFCSLMDWCFNIMNIRNTQSLEFERNI